MKKVTTENKLALSVALALGLVMVGALLQFKSIQNYKNMTRRVDHSRQVQDMLSLVSNLLDTAETSERAYIIIGDEYLRDAYRQAAASVDPELHNLAELTAGNKMQTANIGTLQILIKQRLALLEEMLSEYDRGGIAAVRQSNQKNAIRAVSTGIDELCTTISAAEAEQIRELQQSAYRSANTAEASGIIIIATVLVGFCLIFVRLRREAAEERRKDRLFQDVLEIMPVGVFWTDADGTSLKMNQAAKDIWDGSRDVGPERYVEYRGWNPDSGIPLSSADWPLARALKNGEIIRNELVDIQSFDGNRKTIIVNAMPLRDEHGAASGALTINLDVTEVRRVQRELEAAARINETKRMALALFTGSFDRRTIFTSLLALLAERCPFPVSAVYMYDEWRGVFQAVSTHGLAGDVPQIFSPGEGIIGAAARSGTMASLATGTLRLRTGIGEYEPQQVLMIPVSYQSKLDAILVVGSSEILAPSQLNFLETLADQLGVALHNIRQYDDLRILTEQLRSSWEEIQEKNRQLEEASRLKSEFLANMSHELRTPLNAIIGFSEVLKDGLIGPLAKEQQEYITDIFDSGSHLLSLINDILDLSKVEAGRMQLQLTNVSVQAVVASSIQIVREKALAHRISLTTDVPDDLDTIVADERKLKQILFNLLSNAVKFTPDGGAVSVVARRIVPSSGGRSSLELQVHDTGIGISAEDQAKLFQPFVQIDSTLSRKFEGTGLGLAMVKRLTDLHGGTVTLTSVVGEGSCFCVSVPWRTADEPAAPAAPEAAAAVQEQPSAAPSSSAAQRLVLVVEDDVHGAELMKLDLESTGYRVLTASSAEVALDMLSRELPDLIILDILLPGMDGWEFLERIKADDRLTMIPVVIASVVADGTRGIALGAAQVIQKPVSREQLSATLAAIGMSSADNQKSVLIIDDDPKSVQILRTYFANEKYTVYAAYGGREGIARAQEKQPDLIVLDLMMPEVNGFDVVQALRGSDHTSSIPIIIVTAKQVTDDDRERLKGDVIKIIEKSEFKSGFFIKEIARAMTRRGKNHG
jgi:signal transduction histidine kinase/CheY-like chemotaxis protein/CHASE3 domain sensor protein